MFDISERERDWLFNVTWNDIYVTSHIYTGGLKKLNLRSGSQRHKHFVGLSVFWIFFVGVGAFVIGLSEISSFFF